MSVILSILDRGHMLTPWIPMIMKNVRDQVLPLVQNNVTADWIRYNKFTYLTSLKKMKHI